MDVLTDLTNFPSQKKSESKKTKKWYEDCIKAGASLIDTVYSNSGLRASYKNIETNYNLLNNILDPDDVAKITNPFNSSYDVKPAKIQNYPLINNKIELLVGEDFERKSKYSVRLINPDAVTKKEKDIKGIILSFAAEKIKAESMDEESTKAELEELMKYVSYEYQDLRERDASFILEYLTKEQQLAKKFSDGKYDALVAGEETYFIDIVSQEPILHRIHPNDLFTLRSPNSQRIEDANIICWRRYLPVGNVIDEFHDYLTTKDIKDLEEDVTTSSNDNDMIKFRRNNLILPTGGIIEADGGASPELFDDNRDINIGGVRDSNGNVRVLYVTWKGMEEVIRVLRVDEKTGMEVETIVSSDYEPEDGEKISRIWISKWYEGTLVGEDKFVKVQSRPVQSRGMNNPSTCSSGFVGSIYNVGNNRAFSLVDRAKPLQYMYNLHMYRLEELSAKYHGPIMEIDLAKKPNKWTMDQWLFYANKMGYMIVDSFKEGTKGASTGTLAGNFNTTGKILNPDVSGAIQQTIVILQQIEAQMDMVTGISRQRQANTSSRETVGGIERSVVQSNFMTKYIDIIHEDVKIRAMQKLIETAQYAWSETNKKIQYVTDDFRTIILAIDGAKFAMPEFGLFVNDYSEDAEIRETLKQHAQAALQNDKLDFATFTKILSNKSIQSIIKELDRFEKERKQREAEQAQQQQAIMQEQMQKTENIERVKLELDKYKIDKEAEVALAIAAAKAETEGMKLQAQIDINAENNKTKSEQIDKQLASKQ